MNAYFNIARHILTEVYYFFAFRCDYNLHRSDSFVLADKLACLRKELGFYGCVDGSFAERYNVCGEIDRFAVIYFGIYNVRCVNAPRFICAEAFLCAVLVCNFKCCDNAHMVGIEVVPFVPGEVTNRPALTGCKRKFGFLRCEHFCNVVFLILSMDVSRSPAGSEHGVAYALSVYFGKVKTDRACIKRCLFNFAQKIYLF